MQFECKVCTMNRKRKLAITLLLAEKLSTSMAQPVVFFDIEEDEEEIVISFGNAAKNDSPPRILNYLETVVDNYNRMEFQANFRLSRNAFDYLYGEYSRYILENEGPKICDPRRKLLAVIWLLATPESYRSVGERFGMAKSTLSMSFFHVIDFLNRIAPLIIRWPHPPEKETIKNSIRTKHRLQGVLGAVDGTYVPVKAPASQKVAYTNRKNFTSVTLQGICDHKLKFLDCFVGYPSSVHDNRIFRNSDIYIDITSNVQKYFVDDEKILGDKAYPLHPWCIPPFIDRGNLTAVQHNFNRIHASARSVIERAWALLYGRFRRLRYIDMNVFDYIPCTIIAACVLHNVCLNLTDDTDIDEYIREGQIFAAANNPPDEEPPLNDQRNDRRGADVRNEMIRDLRRERRA